MCWRGADGDAHRFCVHGRVAKKKRVRAGGKQKKYLILGFFLSHPKIPTFGPLFRTWSPLHKFDPKTPKPRGGLAVARGGQSQRLCVCLQSSSKQSNQAFCGAEDSGARAREEREWHSGNHRPHARVPDPGSEREGVGAVCKPVSHQYYRSCSSFFSHAQNAEKQRRE